MAVSGKYGKFEIPHIAADEPVFVLRAQDKLAATAIEMYRSLAESHGARLASGLQAEIDSFRKWSGEKKLPD